MAACTSGSEAVNWREASDNLPTGVTITVEIENPTDGSVHPPGTVFASGTASIGETVPVAQTDLFYVVDASGSTGDLEGCGGNLNGDALSDSVLDCEIAALLEVNDMAATSGVISHVAAAVFGETGASADMSPAGSEQLLSPPGADINGNATPDVTEVLTSITIGSIAEFTAHAVGQSTSYGGGLAAIEDALVASTQTNKLVIFVSDGENNTAPAVGPILAGLPAGTTIHSFAIGTASSCASASIFGSLQDLADATGGSCTEVPDVADLPDVLPSVIAAELTGLTLTLNGAPAAIDTVTPALPQEGPQAFIWSTDLGPLGPGLYELCATAEGEDAIDSEDVTECVNFRINAPPEAVCEDVEVVADANCEGEASIDAGSFDPDGDGFECEVDPEGPYPLGTTEATLTCTDDHDGVDTCEATIEVVDETPPELEVDDLLAEIWPPNHKYHAFSIVDCVTSLTDNCDEELDPHESLQLLRVTSDEPELAPGSGNFCDDIVITGDLTFEVRAERIGGQDGRVYTAYFEAEDAAGNVSSASCRVEVPHDQGPDGAAVDSGCNLCVGESCGGCSLGAPQCD